MLDGILATVVDGIWGYIDSPTPRFVLIGGEDKVFDTALHLAGFCHPYFGRSEIITIDRPVACSSLQQRFEPAIKNGLISIREGARDEETLKGSIVFCDGEKPEDLLRYDPKIIFVLQENQRNPKIHTVLEKPLVLSPDDPYHNVVAFLSLYGKPLEEFRLPKGEVPYNQNRDWRYLGPTRSMAAFKVIQDDLALGLKNKDGSFCPVESYDVLLRALGGENVEPKDLYEALKRCYTTPCLLRDMASYIHDAWTLRTLAFHPDREKKKTMMVPYPVLIQHELPNVDKGFDEDILFSDYLVPLLYVRDFVLRSNR